MHLHPWFALLLTQQSKLGMQVHCVGGQRGGWHCSVVGWCSWVSHPCLVSVLFTAPSLTQNEVFFRNFFPLVSVLFWGVSKPTFKYNSFQLQIRYHTADVLIASNEIASATHLRTRHHCRQTRSSLATNAFCAAWSGDEHFWRWRRARFALETNKLKTYVRTPATHTQLATSDFQTNSSYTRTASYQRLPNRTFVEMIASHNYTHLQTQALSRCGDPKVSRCTKASSVVLRWSSTSSK